MPVVLPGGPGASPAEVTGSTGSAPGTITRLALGGPPADLTSHPIALTCRRSKTLTAAPVVPSGADIPPRRVRKGVVLQRVPLRAVEIQPQRRRTAGLYRDILGFPEGVFLQRIARRAARSRESRGHKQRDHHGPGPLVEERLSDL
jgi:hypothetical protein